MSTLFTGPICDSPTAKPSLPAAGIETISNFFRERLSTFDRVDLQVLDQAEVEALGREAASLRSILEDSLDEGYGDFFAPVIGDQRALERLPSFIDRTLTRLGRPHDQWWFELYPPPAVPPPVDTRRHHAVTRSLGDTLTQLVARACDPRPDVTPYFPDPDRAARWRAQTQAKISELAEYLAWLAAGILREPDRVPVFLLRDTLLPYFGVMWLREAGWALPEPRYLLFNRAMMHALGTDEQAYLDLSGLMYDALAHGGSRTDVDAFVRAFAARARVSDAFRRATKTHLDAVCSGRPPLLVESGYMGSFPLWLLSQVEQGGDFVMYTTAPWLRHVYGHRLFRLDYNGLRALETLVVHEHLFQFESVDDDPAACLVRYTEDECTLALATYELCCFRHAVRRMTHRSDGTTTSSRPEDLA
ncbi:MAG: hypothetical protein AAGF11_36420 [Myxococcota bacterium]